MLLSMDEFSREGIARQLAPVTPVSQVIYSAYMHPFVKDSDSLRRVVVLAESVVYAPFAGQQEAPVLEHHEVAEFLLELLVVEGERVGEVVYSDMPEPSDYVLVPHDQGYRLITPACSSSDNEAHAA